ncbi:MAG: thiamine pyrophosphate-binding protein, partial [Halapricum sp.]
MSERASIPKRDPEEVPERENGIEEVTTGSQSVIAALEQAGVEHAFGVQGGAIMPVYDA